MKIQDYLDQQNDPELAEVVHRLLLIFDLALLSECGQSGAVTAERMTVIARQIAYEQGDGDEVAAEALYQIMLAHWRET